MFKATTALLLLTASTLASAADATYTGKIKGIYHHDRPTNPYFGVELEGEMDTNPCGARKDVFIVNPDDLHERQFSMLLAAQASGATVTITNQAAPADKKCFEVFSTFNFVRIN